MIETNLKHKKQLSALISLISMFVMAANPQEIMDAAKSAFILCASTLLPSLFPFMIASSVFINSVSAGSVRFLSPVFKFLFGISPGAAAALIPGMICGYPVGASCSCQLYQNNVISKSEAESLIAFSNNSGPLFVIGAVGTGILGDARTGMLLYAIHIISAIICGIILKPFTESKKSLLQLESNMHKKNFTDCVSDSTLTLLKICGFVVAFAVINRLIAPAINLLPQYCRCAVAGFLELTNAVALAAAGIENNAAKLILISGALGWSGLSVHMQVKSITAPAGLSMKKYYMTRILTCMISMILSYFTFAASVAPFDNSLSTTFYPILAAAVVLITFSTIMKKTMTHIKKPSRYRECSKG